MNSPLLQIFLLAAAIAGPVVGAVVVIMSLRMVRESRSTLEQAVDLLQKQLVYHRSDLSLVPALSARVHVIGTHINAIESELITTRANLRLAGAYAPGAELPEGSVFANLPPLPPIHPPDAPQPTQPTERPETV